MDNQVPLEWAATNGCTPHFHSILLHIGRERSPTLDPQQDRFDQLMYLNRELFIMIENSISLDLLARLYSSQLVTRGEKHLLDHNRTYYKLLRQIMAQGQQRGELRSDVTVSELVRVYALCERALIYDWCLSGGGYSLPQYSQTMLPLFFGGFRRTSSTNTP